MTSWMTDSYQLVRFMSDGTWYSIEDKETMGWALIIAFDEEVKNARTTIATSNGTVWDSNRISMA